MSPKQKVAVSILGSVCVAQTGLLVAAIRTHQNSEAAFYRLAEAAQYLAKILEREEVELTEFDEIALTVISTNSKVRE